MFDEIVGHNAIAHGLGEYVRKRSVPSGVLLSGPVCSGKLTIALEFARLLNCQNTPAYPYPCVCSNCLLSAKGVQYGTAIVGSREHEVELSVYKRIAETQPNSGTLNRFLQKVRLLMARFSSLYSALEQSKHATAIEKTLTQLKELLSAVPHHTEQLNIEAVRQLLPTIVQPIGELAIELASYYPTQISIETMRKLRSWSYSEHIEHTVRYRCIIIEQCSQLSTQNLNLILKVLEEPPPQTVFVLLSEHSIGLLPTIRSRVHKYSLNVRPPVQQQQVIQFLGAQTAPAVDAATTSGGKATEVSRRPTGGAVGTDGVEPTGVATAGGGAAMTTGGAATEASETPTGGAAAEASGAPTGGGAAKASGTPTGGAVKMDGVRTTGVATASGGGEPAVATIRQLFFGVADDVVRAYHITEEIFDSLGDTKLFLQSINQLVQFANTKPYSRQRDRNLLEMFTNHLQSMLQQEPSKPITQFCSELSLLIKKISYRNQALNIRLTDQVIELATGMNKLHAGLF